MAPDRDLDDGKLERRDLNLFTRGFSRLVPGTVGTRAVTIGVETDRTEYDLGDPVGITVRLRNRIPVPVDLATTGRRVWGWRVDGLLEASDELLYDPPEPRRFSMQAAETMTFEFEWDGRFKRDGTPTRWEEATPGEYEIEAFLAIEPPKTDSATITIRR